MAITVASPPARPTFNQFEVTKISDAAGEFTAYVQVKNSNNVVVASDEEVVIRPGNGTGLRYAASGNHERYTKTDAAITVANARGAYVGAGFAAKAASLETWLQSVGLLPS